MTTALPYRKIYVDSRYSTTDSKSSSNFKVELPVTTQLPDNCVFFVTDVCIPHSWKTVEEGINDSLYVLTVNSNPTSLADTLLGHLVRLAPGNYTPTSFATELQTRLRESVSQGFTVTLDNNNGVVVGNNNANFQWKFLTDNDLTSRSFILDGLSYDTNNLRSANDIIYNIESNDVIIGGENSSVTTYNSGFLKLNWINNIYISCPNLGCFDTIFAGKGDNNIIKKVPVLANYGYMVIDQAMSTNDFLDCSKQTLQTLEFHLKTAKGIYVPLHGAHVSFSLVFNKFNPDL